MGGRVALEKRRPHELIDRYDEEADGEELLARRAVNLGHLGELVEETERDAGLRAEGGGGCERGEARREGGGGGGGRAWVT